MGAPAGADPGMLLALDVGNTNVVGVVYRDDERVAAWRVRTIRDQTADELALTLDALLAGRGLGREDIDALAVSSTVPALADALVAVGREHLRVEALALGPGNRGGLELRVDHPGEVGPDRIANCVAAVAAHGAPAVVVDLGTATHFDIVDGDGAFVGGAIAAGARMAAEALGARAAMLAGVELRAPARAIGTDTASNMQSGAVFGWAGLVDGLVARFLAELGAPSAPVVATGGLAGVVAPHCRTVTAIDPWLTVDGVRLVWQRALAPPTPAGDDSAMAAKRRGSR